MNVWTFTGNLGNDAETSYTQGGTAVCQMSVAVSSGYGDRKKTTWVKAVMFGKRAEGGIVQYLKKGQQVAVSGEAYIEEWEKDGQKRSMLKVNVNDIDLTGGNSGAQNQNQAPQRQQSSPQAPQQSQNDGFADFSDDIPFDLYQRNMIA